MEGEAEVLSAGWEAGALTSPESLEQAARETAMAKAMSRANKREIFFIVVSSKLLRVLYCF